MTNCRMMAVGTIALLHGMSGMNTRATAAAAAVVRPTATTTSPVTGAPMVARAPAGRCAPDGSRAGRLPPRRGTPSQTVRQTFTDTLHEFFTAA